MFSMEVKGLANKRPASTEAKEDEETEEEEADSGNDFVKELVPRVHILDIETRGLGYQLRLLEAWSTTTWMQNPDHELIKMIMAYITTWNCTRPCQVAHPMGPFRVAVNFGIVKYAKKVPGPITKFFEKMKELANEGMKILG